MARPRQPFVAVEHRHLRRRAAFRDDQIGARRSIALWHHESAQILRPGDGRRKTDAGEIGSDAGQARKIERQEVAALRCNKRVQLVENDALERAEQIGRIGGCQEQRELLRSGQQHIGRMAALALAFRRRRVAGSRLDAKPQPHFGDRNFQIAGDVDRERFQRRNIKRVQAIALVPPAERG